MFTNLLNVAQITILRGNNVKNLLAGSSQLCYSDSALAAFCFSPNVGFRRRPLRPSGYFARASVVALLALVAYTHGTATARAADPASAPAAWTYDAAAAAAAAMQPQQTDPALVAAASNANDPASTPQPAPAPAPDPAQLASTVQQAVTSASATQEGAQNIVVIVRINSPGDDQITQANVNAANATGTNTSSTSQNPPPTPQASPSTAKAAAPARAKPRRPAAAAPHPRSHARTAAARGPGQAPPAPVQEPGVESVAAPSSAPVAPAAAPASHPTKTRPRPTSHVAGPAAAARARMGSAVRAAARPSFSQAARPVIHALGALSSFTPQPSATTASQAPDVSGAVLFALLAAVASAAALVAWPQLRGRRRAPATRGQPRS